MLKEYLSNIANAIRSKLGTTDKVNAQDFADKVNEVYDKGRSDEQSDFWDYYQNKGKRTMYDYAFYMEFTNYNSKGDNVWNNTMFKPKYDMKPTSANRMFKGSTFTDFVDICNTQGIVFDTSNCTTMVLMFQSCYFNKRLPIISFAKSTARTTAFAYCTQLETIEGLIFKENDTLSNSEMFVSCDSLKNITILGGSIGNSISFAWSPLSVESMKSIITHLVDYSGTTNEAKYKITFSATRWTNLEESGKPFDDGLTTDETMTWQEYVQNLGWTY